MHQILQEFYQVESTASFLWRGLEMEGKRKIEIEPHDILIKSQDGEHYNRINYSGAVNILIAESKLIKREGRVEFDQDMYDEGYTV